MWRLTGKLGADVIVDYTGQLTWPTSIRTLKPGGRILTCGATTGFQAVTDLRYVWVREETIVGSNGWRRADLESLVALVEARRIVPVVDRILPLERTREAEEAIERSGRVRQNDHHSPAMITRFDHAVIAVHDLDDAMTRAIARPASTSGRADATPVAALRTR